MVWNLVHERIVINGIIFDRKTDNEMSRIFDNIETKFEEGLHVILTNVGVKRAAFCVYENSGAVDHAGILKGGH